MRAEREVIVSAGTYQSPMLLMYSGIGPAEDLALLGIEVREDLPVGENLQDHVMAQLNYLTDEESLFLAVTPENIALLEQEGRGPLSSNIPEAGAFMRTRAGLDAPDVEFHFAPSLFFDEGLTAPSDHGFAFGPVVIKPSSRGRVMLRSPLPDSKPRVLSNFLTTEEDRATMLAGLRMALEIARQPELQAVVREPFSVPASDSDEDLLAFAHVASQTRLPPDLDVRDGRGGRRRAARLRHRGPARRRRIGDADDHARQHERAHDDDRREGGRPDPSARVGDAALARQVGRPQQLRALPQLRGRAGEVHAAALEHVRARRELERDGGELLDQQHADARLGDARGSSAPAAGRSPGRGRATARR